VLKYHRKCSNNLIFLKNVIKKNLNVADFWVMWSPTNEMRHYNLQVRDSRIISMSHYINNSIVRIFVFFRKIVKIIIEKNNV